MAITYADAAQFVDDFMAAKFPGRVAFSFDGKVPPNGYCLRPKEITGRNNYADMLGKTSLYNNLLGGEVDLVLTAKVIHPPQAIKHKSEFALLEDARTIFRELQLHLRDTRKASRGQRPSTIPMLSANGIGTIGQIDYDDQSQLLHVAINLGLAMDVVDEK